MHAPVRAAAGLGLEGFFVGRAVDIAFGLRLLSTVSLPGTT